MLRCVDQFLPPLQLPFGSDLADNHTRLWPYKEGQSKVCVLHLHPRPGTHDGWKKLCRVFVYCVILMNRAHATGYVAVFGKVHQSIGQESCPWAFCQAFKSPVLCHQPILAWITHEARSLQIPSYRNNLHANSVLFPTVALTCCWFSLWECSLACMHSLVSWKACLWDTSAG